MKYTEKDIYLAPETIVIEMPKEIVLATSSDIDDYNEIDYNW